MKWECNPSFLTCVASHGFSAGHLDRLILSGNGTRLSLTVTMANDIVAIAPPVGDRLPAGRYQLEGGSVNAVQTLGTMDLDGACPHVALTNPEDASRAFIVVIGANGTLAGPNGHRDDGLFNGQKAYNSALVDTARSLLFAPEDLLMQVARRGRLNLSFLTPIANNRPMAALVDEIMPNIARPRQNDIASYLSGLKIACDVALLIHGSMDYTRASAMFTVDDLSANKLPFRMDGRKYSFGRATKTPGVATLSYYSFDLSHTPLHEFGHASSELTTGRVIDLYHDQTDSSVLQINKRKGRPIPDHFAKYNATDFGTDPTRDHIGYGTGWSSYHPALHDSQLPNLMDDYWQAPADPLACRFDDLTKTWLLDRVEAKAEMAR